MVGRFTCEDPKRDDLNWYTYCGNDPVDNEDPSGTSWISRAVSAVRRAVTAVVSTVRRVVTSVVSTVRRAASAVSTAARAVSSVRRSTVAASSPVVSAATAASEAGVVGPTSENVNTTSKAVKTSTATGNNETTPIGTISRGISFNATGFFGGIAISCVYSTDKYNNAVLQFSHSVQGNESHHYGLLDVGAGFIYQHTSEKTVYDLTGTATTVGLSAGDSVYGGVDYIYNGYTYEEVMAGEAERNGIILQIGAGFGIDAHIVETQTYTFELSQVRKSFGIE